MNGRAGTLAPLLAWTFLLAALFALAAPTKGHVRNQAEYRTYGNVRFGYAIDYPENVLSPQGEADNSDGQRLLSAHADAVLTVYGRYNVLNESLARLCAEAARGGPGEAPGRVVTYRVLKKDWFVVSGHGGGRIFYCKTLRDKDVLRCMEFVYPERQKSLYNPIAARIARSFRGLP